MSISRIVRGQGPADRGESQQKGWAVPLYLMLGLSAGAPFYMFNAVLTLRLARHGIDIAIIGFFAWIALLPTLKFLWAPLIDRFDIPGFSRFWGKKRGWIMLSQLGISLSLAGMTFVSDDRSLPLTALFATLLAFWTTTLEIAADGWRIELAPNQTEQARLVTANLWGYRGAMIAAGSGAIYLAAWRDWTAAYGVIAAVTFIPFLILCATLPDARATVPRRAALATGLVGGSAMLAISAAIVASAGWLGFALVQILGVDSRTNVTPVVLMIALLPFALVAAALPRVRRMSADAPALHSPAIGPYLDICWRFGLPVLPLLAFISCYRLGDVMTLTLSHPLWNARGYTLGQIATADGAVAILAALTGVAAGGWLAARSNLALALVAGALASAGGNWIFVWLWRSPPSATILYIAAGIDQFAHGLASAVFVVFLSMLVNPRWPGAQYAILSGWALLLPRLISGAAGTIQARLGYEGFFWLSGALSAAAILVLPLLMPTILRARADGSRP